MMERKRCDAYDQIRDRGCCYYAGHGGRHNFARLDHDYLLERELRSALDAMTAARDEACVALENMGAGARAAELRKVGT